MGQYLSIDETSLSQGELHTFITNKAAKGKKGSLVAVIKGTSSNRIIEVLQKVSIHKRSQVKEVTLDMANNMELSMKEMFVNASLVTDRFHVVQLVMEALQHCRVKERWIELDKENEAIKQVREAKKKYKLDLEKYANNPKKLKIIIENTDQNLLVYKPELLENGETPKQLLARTRYVLAKKEDKWTMHQKEQAEILFKRYPNLKTAYHHCLSFRNIYEETDRIKAEKGFNTWINNISKLDIKEFNTAANTVRNNLENILNFFINRNTNANAESFNSKIKLFRANQRGVTDTKFFLFRLHKLFA
jgi:transposase